MKIRTNSLPLTSLASGEGRGRIETQSGHGELEIDLPERRKGRGRPRETTAGEAAGPEESAADAQRADGGGPHAPQTLPGIQLRLGMCFWE